jgi:hypothetical protein
MPINSSMAQAHRTLFKKMGHLVLVPSESMILVNWLDTIFDSTEYEEPSET